MIVRIGRNDKVVIDCYESLTETLVAVDDLDYVAMEYTPKTETPKSSIAVVIMHCDQNYMGMKMGPELAARGYHVLVCQSYEGGDMDEKIKLLGRYMKYLRSNPKIKKIVLAGHSGGATLMSAYQSVAENGAGIYQGDNMIYKCRVSETMDPADGIMLIDANYGNAVMTLLSVDPAIIEEGCGLKLNPEFDIFDPDNGYDKNGAKYSPYFLRKYFQAQKKRYDALIAHAIDRLEKIRSGEGNYVDDEPFIITAANQPKPNNRLLPEDPSLLSHTKGEYDLLHKDGSITHEQVFCLRTAEFDRSLSEIYQIGANKNTVIGFLSSQAVRTSEDYEVKEDGIIGIDWKSSYATPIGNIEDIQVPALFMGMTGSYEYLASEIIWEHAKMEDKSIAFVQGADHRLSPNHKAEQIPGEFGDTEKVIYDHMASWMERFTDC